MSERVLVVVEDDPDLLAGWQDLFEFSGYKVYGFSSALAALNDAEAIAQADVLITDYHLGDVNGVGLIRRARAVKPNLPALVLTGLKRDDVVAAVQAEGDIALFYKPVDIFKVEEHVEDLLAAAGR